MPNVQMVEVWRITPPHESTDDDRVAVILASLREAGWRGRPLLVERLDDEGTAFQAWTGAHRLAAALDVVDAVPVHEIDLALMAPHFEGELDEGEAVFDRAVDDEQRLAVLVEVGDVEAAQLMRAEFRARRRQ